MKKIPLLLLLSSLWLCACAQEKPYLVVLSMDGFRWDYPDRAHTPVLDSLARVGVKAEAIRPAFPSKTFPNHYTMATGLYPDHHGLVNNSFFDPATGSTYTMRDQAERNNPKYYGGEPIWVTAELQNVRTASYFWVGSELPIKGIQPSIWKPYLQTVPLEDRIDSVIAWLKLPEHRRPRLIMWYLHEPDAVGHMYGPDDKRTLQKAEDLDRLLGVFCRKLGQLPIASNINLIVTSDHGMGKISAEKSITLTDYVKESWVDKAIGGNPVYSIKAKQGFVDSIYNRLSKVKNIQVWKSGEVPKELNYGTHPRTLDIIVAADSAWSIGWRRGSSNEYSGGTHGYDIRNKDMHAIFYAAGPSFKSGYRQPVFDNIDLYPLFAHILGIIPQNVDGSLDAVQQMLRTTTDNPK